MLHFLAHLLHAAEQSGAYRTMIRMRSTARAGFKRRRFLKGKARLSATDFLDRLIVSPAESPCILACRRAIADMAQVPPESIHPEDAPDTLAGLMPYRCRDGWDATEFWCRLQQELGAKLENELLPRLPLFCDEPGKEAARTIGEWMVNVAGALVYSKPSPMEGRIAASGG